jgi:hypothetical protein
MHSAMPLGRLLVKSGLLTQQALDDVLVLQKTDGRRLGELLAEKGLVRPHQLAQFLSHQLSCPWVSLQRVEIAPEAVEVLPRSLALKHHMVPVHLRTAKGATVLYVAMDDPTDDVALAEAADASRLPVKPMVALSSEIQTHLDRLYGVGATGTTPPPMAVLATPTKPPKPPPPMTVPPPDPSVLDVIDVIEEPPDAPKPLAKVLVIGSDEAFTTTVRASASRLGGEAIGVPPSEVAKAVLLHDPCAFIVKEETYLGGRSDLDRLALESAALLIVSSAAFGGRQLEGLLESAIKRWRRSSYEKGAVLEGRYELLRDLGGAIAGSRWEVRHLRTARRSILKVGVRLPGTAVGVSDESDADAVRRENTALARFQHPGAVDLRDAGNTELGDPYVVIEMLEGRSLEGLVAARGALAPAEGCALIRQVADVLASAHDAGVRHGDVRPENILVVRDGWGVERAKLVNWESATLVESGGEVDDLAGIGTCAFFALAGRSRNEGENVRSIRSGMWGRMQMPPELAAVVARTLPGAGADRFGSVRELVEALAAVKSYETSSTELLEAKPERRASIKPVAPEAAKPAVQEMRRYPRAAYRTPVRVEVTGVGAVDGRSEDISERGLFVVTRGKIAADAVVTVRFALPIDGKVVSETGVVRWSRAPNTADSGAGARAIGIELTSPSAESIRQIARYVSFMAAEK